MLGSKRIDGFPHGGAARQASMSFETLVALPEKEIDAFYGAVLLANDFSEPTRWEDVDAAVEEIAAPLYGLRLHEKSLADQQTTLAQYLSKDLGFRGSESDYYDPRNSFIPELLKRKRANPITLSTLWCEVGDRVGLCLRGIGFPGHYFLRLESGDSSPAREAPLYVDPFFGGRVLTEDQIEALMAQVVGRRVPVSPGHLSPTTPRRVLLRMLENLRGTYLSRGEDGRAFLAVDRLLLFYPNTASRIIDRARLAARLGEIELARSDYDRALANPELPEKDRHDVEEEKMKLSAASAVFS